MLLKSFLLLSIHWLARILAVLFIILVSIFAFDVFGQGTGFWKTLLALVIHLIPTFLLIIVFIVSIKWGWAGAIFFTLAGIAYLIWQGFEYPVIFVPLFVVGILFFLDWYYRDQIEKLREEIR